MRAYIGLVRDLSFSIQQPMTSFLENDLTAARQRDSSVSTSTMHTWLTVRATNSIHLSLVAPLSQGSGGSPVVGPGGPAAGTQSWRGRAHPRALGSDERAGA